MTNTFLIKPRLTDSAKSYWAMFYCSIMKTLINQKNIPYQLNQDSLRSYRGELRNPANFFNQIKSAIKNHGFEYLMTDFLRSEDGRDTLNNLLNSLLTTYGINDFEYQYMNVFKIGEDSALHQVIEKYEDPDAQVFFPDGNIFFNRKKTIIQTLTYPLSKLSKTFINCDLLIMISDGKNHTYGFVGEVEGGHGEELFRKNYWDKNNKIKSKYTSFAIGSSDRKKVLNGVQPKGSVVLHKDEGNRWILHFSNSNQFIKDFTRTINNIDMLLGGHSHNIDMDALDDSHRDIINIITEKWATNIRHLIDELEKFIEYSISKKELYSQHDDEESEGGTIFKPSLITLDDRFYLHKIRPPKLLIEG